MVDKRKSSQNMDLQHMGNLSSQQSTHHGMAFEPKKSMQASSMDVHQQMITSPNMYVQHNVDLSIKSGS